MKSYLPYLIISVFFVYFIIVKVIPFIKKASKITKGLFSKIYLNKNSTLSTEQYKKIALGAIYSEQQTAFINSLETGLGKSSVKDLLSNWWSINNSEDAYETLNYLQSKGFRFYLPVVFSAFSAPSSEQEAIILNGFTNEEDIEKALSQLQNLKEVLNELKSESIISQESDIMKYGSNGWDSGRLVFLARLCYDAGYISKQEAWDFIESANIMARKTFTSWNDYAKSYVLGRGMWGGAQSANQGIASIAEYLLEVPNSPWVQMSW
jgi:hypothetical protein